MPISYFFADLQSDGAERSIEDKTWREQLQRPETIELIRLSYAISNPEIRQGRDAGVTDRAIFFNLATFRQ